MTERIPTYELRAFASGDPTAAQVFFPDYATGGPPRIPLHRPYRGNYYKISLCLRGAAQLTINLHPYAVTPGCLVLATPDVIKQWTHLSADYETLSVFFTREFITANNAATGRLGFLVAPTAPVLPLSAPEAANIAASFRFLQQKYHTPNAQRTNILQSILLSLLFELGALYAGRQPLTAPAGGARRQQLAAAFRGLLQTHGAAVRSVAFYAAALCVTPKHLTEQVKAATGRTAREWIAETVVLEAKALLQDPALTINQVAATLEFADQFAFSRFFKNCTGVSPTAYRLAG
ncbi:helix-turn-helix domain-containing protein [Hymenobacter persicinus]|uniref:AraC family transcriptional regulator n=1 Tax=Hymenobacter persicinus TaxID=2025506 RepID=A0A4Q5LF81_9BACT|nr:helix-turn-helix transcriptional regulator [Hymenobacter persicinus]RYU83369.1 AraC family transcriptional regulator [Hymenobacter persicinus]